ncbi:hypothetical protein DPMN_046766 [Dreissena polymorpha]|uniref:Uncharacterized protein n=1 Tax=Dreissena polymorpha TaxID=45954 RepID=A0A9D4D6J0_DREPO|nr:hypothetical protein DPMN_046766 [Dreissena polymorpha]
MFRERSNPYKENAKPIGGHVFTPYIIRTNVMIKFHKDLTHIKLLQSAQPTFHIDWTIQVTSTALTMFHYSHIMNIFRPLATNFLTKFQKDRTIHVNFRVLTRFYYSHIIKDALSHGGHVFQLTEIIFEPIQDIIITNVLTKFHKHWVMLAMFFNQPYIISKLVQDINGTDVLTKRQMFTPHAARRTTDTMRSQKLL